MSENRKRCLYSILNAGVEVRLVTPQNLSNYVLPDHPLHKSYDLLTPVHKADYLRTYFMHFHGGGYTDIKETKVSWKPYFDLLRNSEKVLCGYKEVGPNGVAVVEEPLYSFLKTKWETLPGNCAYICKPRSIITTKWLHQCEHILDLKYELLLKNRPTDYRDHYEKPMGNFLKSNYPLRWSEILGSVFQPIAYLHRDLVDLSLPPPNFNGYW
jgi:hypothetical protein